MNLKIVKILMLTMLLIISTPVTNAELPDKSDAKTMSIIENSIATTTVTDVNYFGELMTLYGHNVDLAYVDWSPDGTKIVSSDWESGIKIWNATDGSLLNNLIGHSNAVWTVKWSPDGTKIASASWDKTVRVWDALTGQQLAVYNHTSEVWGLEWSPDGTKILSGAADGRLTLWDVSAGNPVMNLTNHTGLVAAIEWSPDGTKVATGDWANKIIIWNASTYEIIGTYDYLLNTAYQVDDVEGISWSSDSSRIAAGGDNGNFTIINVLNGDRIDVLNVNNGIWGVSWSPDGTKIATAMRDANIFIWDINGNIIRKLTGHIWWVETVAWSPDGTKLASGADDDTVRIWGDLREVISAQKEIIQKQQASLGAISANLTRFEQSMQSTFGNPNFSINGTTSEEKVKTLVDALINLSRGAKNELYKLLGYK